MSTSFRFFALTFCVLLTACGGEPMTQPDAGPRPDGGPATPDAGPPVTVCTAHADCDDGSFCNGAELCRPGDALADPRGCIPAPTPPCMASQTCNDTMGRCESDCGVDPDADDDTYMSASCGGDDCDDADSSVHPGGDEVCDMAGRNEDCDGDTLSGADETDLDHDGYVAEMCCNIQRTGAVRCGLDCDDGTAAANPAHPEVCDGIDNDCDGMVDEHAQTTFYRDADADLYGDESDTMEACTQPDGYVASPGDCDDGMSTVHPTAAETCNDADDDCDTMIDEEVTPAPETPENCGGCGLVCPAGYTCNGSVCEDAPVKIAAAATSTCALTQAGNVYCWGGNADGEVGVGSDAAVVDRPTQVSLPLPAIDIGMIARITDALTLAYTTTVCAVLQDHTVACWGHGVGNSPGPSPWGAFPASSIEFGGSLVRTSTGDVVRVSDWTTTSLGPASAITNGTCARSTSGVLACANGGSTTTYPTVDGGELQSGTTTVCATRADGRLLCWGANGSCQTAFSGTGSVSTPQLVSGLPTLALTSVAANGQIIFRGLGAPPLDWGHTCAALVDGRAYCWGRNARGELGIGAASGNVCTPTLVLTTARFVQLTAGLAHTCGITDAGEVWCWGANNGALGTADVSDSPVPVRLYGFPVMVPPDAR